MPEGYGAEQAEWHEPPDDSLMQLAMLRALTDPNWPTPRPVPTVATRAPVASRGNDRRTVAQPDNA